MTDFKAKMHQIRFRLTVLPQTPLLDSGAASWQGEGLSWGRRGKGEGEGGEVEGTEREGPKLL